MTEKAAFALATFPLQFEAKKTRESRGIIYNFSSFSFRLLSLLLLFLLSARHPNNNNINFIYTRILEQLTS